MIVIEVRLAVFTVKSAEAETESLVAVIVALPATIPVAKPDVSTVAIKSSLDAHVTTALRSTELPLS